MEKTLRVKDPKGRDREGKRSLGKKSSGERSLREKILGGKGPYRKISLAEKVRSIKEKVLKENNP